MICFNEFFIILFLNSEYLKSFLIYMLEVSILSFQFNIKELKQDVKDVNIFTLGLM